MGLTYHFQFASPAATPASELAEFLGEVEFAAKEMGFGPTLVVNGPFDTTERREFARRLTTGRSITDAQLKRPRLPDNLGTWMHDGVAGSCRIAPEHGVILVLTDEHGQEGVFGFFRYPALIRDRDGNEILRTGLDADWTFSEFLKTGDARYRRIVRMFDEAGFLVQETDDYPSVANR